MKRWKCHHAGCPKSFEHARFLTTHLIQFHNEMGTK